MSGGAIVLVCGGRDYWNREVAFEALDKLDAVRRIETIIQGGAPGADKLALSWAQNRKRIAITFDADWRSFGKAAGPIRNREMLREGKPDIVLALPGGRGTANMVGLAKKFGVPVIEVPDAPPLPDAAATVGPNALKH